MDEIKNKVVTVESLSALHEYNKGAYAARDELVDLIYPVGSIYIAVNAANPSTLFGGTWEQLKDRFLLAAGDTYKAGSTGGEATHTLTVDEMPNHSHGIALASASSTNGTAYAQRIEAYSTNTQMGQSAANEAVGGSQPHNNMPPYLTVYMWERTA